MGLRPLVPVPAGIRGGRDDALPVPAGVYGQMPLGFLIDPKVSLSNLNEISPRILHDTRQDFKLPPGIVIGLSLTFDLLSPFPPEILMAVSTIFQFPLAFLGDLQQYIDLYGQIPPESMVGIEMDAASETARVQSQAFKQAWV